MLDRRLLKNFDLSLFLLTVAICAYGMVILNSATLSLEFPPLYFVKRQALWIGLGLAIMFFICLIDYINLANWSRYLYFFNIGLLLLVPFIGVERYGAQRWIPLGFFDLQPSEIAKLVIIISLGRLLAEREDFEHFADLFPTFIHVALPMGLIIYQPDLGTSLVFLVIMFGMLFMAGAQIRHLAAIAAVGVASLPLLFPLLEDYQKARLLVFINPDIDPLGVGYQILQSKIAIGSGGIAGKGLFAGSQAQRQFLPEQQTDFIFSVLGEELGLIGALLLFLLFALLIYRILRIASIAKDRFGFLICCGVAVMFTFQIVVNIGMTVGIMPVTGLPLPFISYGGSSMLLNLMAVGLVLNVGMRRHKIQF
ncbi:MAG: rod shape-determining protein RodA [Dethiobacteria bacterium]|jgi:rod shape determining protein RodA